MSQFFSCLTFPSLTFPTYCGKLASFQTVRTVGFSGAKGLSEMTEAIFLLLPVMYTKSENNLSLIQRIHQEGIYEQHRGNILFLKLVSFLQLSVYPLQIPKPHSVKLTNEAIKFRVSNSFELHLLSESFNIPTEGSQTHQGYLAPWAPFLKRDHQLTLICQSFPEGQKKERDRRK